MLFCLLHLFLFPLVVATSRLLSEDTRAYLDEAVKRWNLPGLSVVAVSSRNSSTGSATEFYNYGVADRHGAPVTEDVSLVTIHQVVSA